MSRHEFQPPAVEAATPIIATVSAIGHDPEDWLWATWRPRTSRPRPEPKPFKVDRSLRQLAKLKCRKVGGVWDWHRGQGEAGRRRLIGERRESCAWDWDSLGLSPCMTPEEARFWLVAMTEVDDELKPDQLAARVEAAGKSLGGAISTTEALRRLKGRSRFLSPLILMPLATVFSPGEWLDLLQETFDWDDFQSFDAFYDVIDGVRHHVLPYLTEAEHRTIRDAIRLRLGIASHPRDHFPTFPVAYYLAAIFGLHDEVAAIVRSVPDDYYSPREQHEIYQRPQLLVLGLGDPQQVESEMRRLKLVLNRPEYLRGWLAHTDDTAHELVRDGILTITRPDDWAALLAIPALIKSARTAGTLLEMMLSSDDPSLCRCWLDANPDLAIAGLIPVATGKGKLADAALEYLRVQERMGRDGSIRACLSTVPPDLAEKIRSKVLDRPDDAIPALDAETTPDWLRTACDEAKTLKPPGWVAPGDLPAILVEGRKLNKEQGTAVLAALARSTLDAPHPLVEAVKAHADRRSCDAFVWALFERWLLGGTPFERWSPKGAPSKEKWAIGALGLLGSDGTALKLTPLIRGWPGESQHPRAAFGLECLRAIGTDGALMQLNGIAHKLSFKGLKARAIGFMERIAQDRGLSRAELEDRVVPDCDLDDRGSRVFDFGPRQFRFALGNEMKPMVRDEAGKLRDDLPKPGARDDATGAAAAVEDWKRLKKQVREVVKLQAERLEQAMVSGRRWSPADFETLLVRHPLMIHLVRLVLWGGHDESGKLVSTFRVTEERDFADVHEAAYRLDGLASVGIVHPFHLSDEQRFAWGEVFGDYETIPPFPQLGRAVHRLEPGQEKDKDLLRGEKIKVASVTLVGILERNGWDRAIPSDAGYILEHTRPFVAADVTAVIQYSGILVGSIVDWDDQELQKCIFVPGIHSPTNYLDHRETLPLGDVDSVVISEVLWTLSLLTEKGK